MERGGEWGKVQGRESRESVINGIVRQRISGCALGFDKRGRERGWVL